MGPLDAFWHLINLFLPAIGLGALAPAAARLIWRHELAGQSWRHLATPAMAACASMTLVGLLVWGRDGKMATYGAMVAACAITLWWRGFGPGRQR